MELNMSGNDKMKGRVFIKALSLFNLFIQILKYKLSMTTRSSLGPKMFPSHHVQNPPLSCKTIWMVLPASML